MRFAKRPLDLAALCAGLALWAAPAPAVDLTGTWAGMQVCQYYRGSVKTMTFRDDVLRLTQTGSDIFFTSEVVGGDTFHARLIEDAHRPADKAQAIFVHCETTAQSTYQELGRAHKLQIVDGGQAIFEGSSSFFQVDPDDRFLGSCDWYYRRVDTQDPGLTACGSSKGSTVAAAGGPRKP
jgi:hypothetical protein